MSDVRLLPDYQRKKKRKGGKKHRKYGRNKVKCARYRAEGRRERNKARRAARRSRRKAASAVSESENLVRAVVPSHCDASDRQIGGRRERQIRDELVGGRRAALLVDHDPNGVS